jgi:hypothetical protein
VRLVRAIVSCFRSARYSFFGQRRCFPGSPLPGRGSRERSLANNAWDFGIPLSRSTGSLTSSRAQVRFLLGGEFQPDHELGSPSLRSLVREIPRTERSGFRQKAPARPGSLTPSSVSSSIPSALTVVSTLAITPASPKGRDSSRSLPNDNSGSCLDARQYYGKLVSGVDATVQIGAYRFPQDDSITAF